MLSCASPPPCAKAAESFSAVCLQFPGSETVHLIFDINILKHVRSENFCSMLFFMLFFFFQNQNLILILILLSCVNSSPCTVFLGLFYSAANGVFSGDWIGYLCCFVVQTQLYICFALGLCSWITSLALNPNTTKVFPMDDDLLLEKVENALHLLLCQIFNFCFNSLLSLGYLVF